MRNKAVEKWIEQFNASFAGVEGVDLASLFQEEFFWRDILCISWSLNTFETHQEVLGALKQNKATFPQNSNQNRIIRPLAWMTYLH